MELNEELELLSHMIKDLTANVDKLTATVVAHQRDWERFRRMMKAALDAWLNDNEEQQ